MLLLFPAYVNIDEYLGQYRDIRNRTLNMKLIKDLGKHFKVG